MAMAPSSSPEGGREFVLSVCLVFCFSCCRAAPLHSFRYSPLWAPSSSLPPPHHSTFFSSQILLVTPLLFPQANRQGGTQGLLHNQGAICFSRLIQSWQVQTNAWWPSCPAARLYGRCMWHLGEAQDIWVRREVLVHPAASFKAHVPWW